MTGIKNKIVVARCPDGHIYLMSINHDDKGSHYHPNACPVCGESLHFDVKTLYEETPFFGKPK